MFLASESEKDIEKINAHKWTLIVDGIRDNTYAKIKNGKVHVLDCTYDEDGYISRDLYIGDTYNEAIENDPVMSHWEEFDPIDIDADEDDWNE